MSTHLPHIGVSIIFANRESGLQMAGDWAFSGVNKFGQAFLSHFRGVGLNHPLLKKVGGRRSSSNIE